MNFGLVIKDLLMGNLMRAQFSGLRRGVENVVLSKIMANPEVMQDSDGDSDIPSDELLKRAWAIEYFLHDDMAMEALLKLFEGSSLNKCLPRLKRSQNIRILSGSVP